jgi:hypothetical protein
VFVSAESSPTGRPLLLAGYEGVEGSIAGSVAVLEVVPSRSRIVNGSIRATAVANQTTIVGFVSSGADPVLLRAIGPGLANFGVTGVLEDPRVALFAGASQVDANDDWSSSADLTAATSAVGAFGLTPGSRDAVLLRPAPGAHTLHLAARTAGAVLMEFYSTGVDAGFGNFSARSRVGAGEGPVIGGFIVAGTGTKKVLVRAVGPRLAAFGVAGALADPRLDVYRGSIKVGENDDWAQGATAADFAAAGAFMLEGDAKSSAMVLTVTPGASYTVHASGNGGGAGDVLLEVYELR